MQSRGLQSRRLLGQRLSAGCLLLALILVPKLGAENPAACKRINFRARVAGGQMFRHPVGSQLELVFDPYPDNSGWDLRVSPIGSTDDWTYPVNLPLNGEAQSLGSGYGMTAEDRLVGTQTFYFAFDSSDFVRYSLLAHEASGGLRAGGFIGQLEKATLGSIVLSNFDDENDGSPDKIKWAEFDATIIVPRSFNSGDSVWLPCVCPQRQKR